MLGILLAKHFSADLDRLTLWKRIGAGVMAACAKSPGGEPETFLSAALEFVKADVSSVGRDPIFNQVLSDMTKKSKTWREGFVRYLRAAIYAVMQHMRHAWKSHIEKPGEIKAEMEDGEL